MKLTLENIGKIKNADICLNGITVIAGENNTGKSTVGKALFSVFNVFYDINNQIECERKYSIERLVVFFLRDIFGTRYFSSSECDEFIEEIKNSSNLSKEDVKRYFVDFIERKNIKYDDDAMLDNVVGKIYNLINISEDEVLRNIVIKQFGIEFADQVNNIFSEEPGNIKLTIKDKNVSLKFKDNSVIDIDGKFDMNTEAVYVDNPFVLDEQRFYQFGSRIGNYSDHKNHLRKKLFSLDMSGGIINEIISNNKLDGIYEKISNICSGKIVKKGSRAVYQKNGENKVIEIKNLSTGLKNFVILKTLLQNGTLKENGTIILDEPEIHLHPQWQMLFAEIIVLIQKEFDMHILLNTHSPYFLKAIEVFSSKYNIADRCKYYIARLRGEFSFIEDVTENTEEIYKLLARPLQELENLRYEND